MAPAGSVQKPPGMHTTMDNLPLSGDVHQLLLQSSGHSSPNLLGTSENALDLAQPLVTSAPIRPMLGMHANTGQVSGSADAEGLPQQSSMQGTTLLSGDAESGVSESGDAESGDAQSGDTNQGMSMALAELSGKADVKPALTSG